MKVAELRGYVSEYLIAKNEEPYTGNGRKQIPSKITLKSQRNAGEIPGKDLMGLIIDYVSKNPFKEICDELCRLTGLTYTGFTGTSDIDKDALIDPEKAMGLAKKIRDYSIFTKDVSKALIADMNHICTMLVKAAYPDDDDGYASAFNNLQKELHLDDVNQ